MKSRRTAILLTVAATAALPVLAGCGSDNDSDSNSGSSSGQTSGDTGAMGATGATSGGQADGSSGATGAATGAQGAAGTSGIGGVQPPHGQEPLSANDKSQNAPDNSISNRPGGPNNEPGRKQK